MRGLLCLIVLLVVCAVASGQETQSVLVNPPPAVQQVPPTPMPQPTFLIQRGLFGWRAKPLYPVQVVVVRPRPVVVWTPWVVWR